MIRTRPASLLLCLGILAVLTGCDYGSSRQTFSIEANDTARASVMGRRPAMRITNEGPGEVTVRFFADKYPVGDGRRLEAGGTTAEALGGAFSAIVEAGETGTELLIEAEMVRRLIVERAGEK